MKAELSNSVFPKLKKIKRLTAFQIIILGFAGVILFGALLLCLPFATRDGQGASFFDALFTATSAVCVTGLVVHDTVTYWSVFGQVIIIMLIQIGGMGVITVSVTLGLISRRRVSLSQRNTMLESVSAPNPGTVIKFTKFIVATTAITEILGALVMFPVFYDDYGFLKGLWYSVFHSVSAFCNAGFDLMGAKGEFSSLTSLYSNPVINLVITFLIVFGGIGFVTWDDMRTNGIHLKKYKLQSKIALATTAILIAVPFLYFYCFEFSRDYWNTMSAGDKVLASLFQTITPRTAGFNTVNLDAMSEVSKMLMVMLMLIGGSPGSTAGGMKTTTVAVLFASSISVFKRRNDAESFKRRIPINSVRYAAAVLSMYLMLFLGGSLIIAQTENLPLLDCFYEAASAIGTVGLTLGITPSLHASSRFILMMLMFFGRVGGLTLMYATLSNSMKKYSKYPQEKVAVG